MVNLMAIATIAMFYVIPAVAFALLLVWVILDRIKDKEEEDKDDYGQY